MSKDLNSYSPKEEIQMEISIWKDAQHYLSLGKCKLKQQDAPTYLLE